ncbi:MAG: PIN domain-containing protein [Geminicoccaceae bacterium]|nr:PIN domain-containing protein [Geminicoccaceae bacterium]
MDDLLLDTSVVSFFLPSRNRSERARYEPHLEGRRPIPCFQSMAELRLLARKNAWGDRREENLRRFLAKVLVVPADAELAEAWAEVTTASQKFGRRLETADAWIVATALRYDLPLVTHDRDQLILEDLGGRVITELP